VKKSRVDHDDEDEDDRGVRITPFTRHPRPRGRRRPRSAAGQEIEVDHDDEEQDLRSLRFPGDGHGEDVDLWRYAGPKQFQMKNPNRLSHCVEVG
jgi:hypothetical protein